MTTDNRDSLVQLGDQIVKSTAESVYRQLTFVAMYSRFPFQVETDG